MAGVFQKRICISKKATFLSIIVCLTIGGYLFFTHTASQNKKTLQSKAVGIADTVRKQEVQKGGWTQVDGAQWPFVVTVRTSAWLATTDCTGTLIAPDWVLTAAHCVVDVANAPYNVSIVYGSGITIDQILVYPDLAKVQQGMGDLYPHYAHDIALLKLHTPMNKPTISLPRTALFTDTDKYPFVIMQAATTTLIQQKVVPIIPRYRANSWYGNAINPDELALGYPDGNTSICPSDSGPAIIWDSADRQWVQVGVASWRVPENCGGTAFPHAPGIFTDVASYTQWIQDQTHITPLSGSFTSPSSIITPSDFAEFATRILGQCDRRLPSCRCELDFLPDSVCPILPTLPPEAVPSLLPLPPSPTPSPSPTPPPIVLHAL